MICNCEPCNRKAYEQVDVDNRTINTYSLYNEDEPRGIKTNRAVATAVRDRINNIKDLVEVCKDALLYNLEGMQTKNVAHTLIFFVLNELTTAEQELKDI